MARLQGRGSTSRVAGPRLGAALLRGSVIYEVHCPGILRKGPRLGCGRRQVLRRSLGARSLFGSCSRMVRCLLPAGPGATGTGTAHTSCLPVPSLGHTQEASGPFSPLQVNVIHTANPVDHASHMAAQPQFVHPEHHSFVDLSGHNLANPHPFAGRMPEAHGWKHQVSLRALADTLPHLAGSTAAPCLLPATRGEMRALHSHRDPAGLRPCGAVSGVF